ncbi:histidine kinase [Flavobacterium sp. 7A]|uniref:sensor histidine kinase n=1 Tax=Flavobacterium sp. 7A TaxID=2940571 RepID=UPI002227F5BA|nr:histidine kinase [Flavobacterium sp. 7A]MCW2118184.1 hypothetical protein [Flavobacterium sp. 7A]
MQLLARFFLLFLFVNSSFAQYLPSKNYSTTNGLPNNAVRALFLDSKNTLWIGTENGVSRFENGTFFNITESDGLGYNSCWDIAQDSNGAMWFASYGGGVSKYDGEKFTVFTTKEGLPVDRVRKLLCYKGKMYVGTELGVSIIDIKTNKVITPKGILPHYEVFIVSSFFLYKDEVYFSAVNEGFFKIDNTLGLPKIVPVLEHQYIYASGHFGNILYGSNKGYADTFDFDKKTNKINIDTKFGKSVIWQYAKDKNDHVYAAAWGVFEADGGLYRIINNKMVNVSNYYGIDSKNLLNVVYDKVKDVLYVGSKDKGVYKVRLDQMIDYNPFNDKAIIDFEDFNEKKIVLHQEGITILNNKNEFDSMISLLDFKKKESDFILKNKLRLPSHEEGYYELNYDIKANKIEFYELVKHKSSLWVSSNIGVFEINIEGKIIGYLPLHTYKFGFTSQNQFIETIPYAGVHLYDDVYSLKRKLFSQFDKDTPLDVVDILNYKDKTYLISVFKGLFVYKNNQFQSYVANGIWSEHKFKHITVNDRGQLILSTEFGNVFIIEDDNLFKIKKVIPGKRIIGNTILFLEAYKDCILIGTERGINVYQNGIMRLIDKEQGLKNAEVSTAQIFGDQLWLGTQKGYYSIDLKEMLKDQKTVSSIAISGVAINGVEMNKAYFKWFEFSSNSITCDYKHNSFLIDFVPIGHSFPNKLKFRYRLKSTNRWSPYSEETNLFLPYLPDDKYLLEIQVYDANAGKTTSFRLLHIDIQPPFWTAWWFVLVCLLVILLSGVFFIVRSRTRTKERISVEKRIAETKLEALLSQMNPHFTFNAMNAIQDFIISNDVDNSLKYIGSFAKLMRKTLENSSRQNSTIDEELDYLKLYISIENMRFEDRIEFEIKIGPKVDVYFFQIPTMLLQPFVENVFVHAFDEGHPNPKLIISFEMIEIKLLECKIIDNGKGFTTLKEGNGHQSKGIDLTKERLGLRQSKVANPINIIQSKNKGTTVIIHLEV